MKKQTVDVIIPLYNNEKYIKETLVSIENQSVKPQKVVVVNDGATDQSQFVVEKFMKESQMNIVLINQTNRGRNAARNRGLKESHADFVAFLDSDDVWHPDKLKNQMNLFSQKSEIGLVYTDFFTIDEGGHTLNPSFLKSNPTFQPLEGVVKDALFRGNRVLGSSSSVLIRRSLFDLVGLFDEDLHAFEDWDMWLRIAENHSFGFVAQPLVGIRKHDGNSQNSADFMRDNHLLFLLKWRARLGKGSHNYKKLRRTMVKRMVKSVLKGDLKSFFIILRAMKKDDL